MLPALKIRLSSCFYADDAVKVLERKIHFENVVIHTESMNDNISMSPHPENRGLHSGVMLSLCFAQQSFSLHCHLCQALEAKILLHKPGL